MKPYTPFEIHGPAFLQAINEGRDLDAFEIAYQAGKTDAEQITPTDGGPTICPVCNGPLETPHRPTP